MGRGRQKAKHTKVARELKYFSPDTNYNALERELTHVDPNAAVPNERLEEDLEKWPEFNAPADYSADNYQDDEFRADREQNTTA